jgi:hypothetical protein
VGDKWRRLDKETVIYQFAFMPKHFSPCRQWDPGLVKFRTEMLTICHRRSVFEMSRILAERTEETHVKLQSCSRPAFQDSDTAVFVCIDVTVVHETAVLVMLGLMVHESAVFSDE